MSLRENERDFTTEVFGRNQDAKNLARKAGASIYHSLTLHPTGLDNELRGGILRTLGKVMTKEDMKKVLVAHDALDKHNLK